MSYHQQKKKILEKEKCTKNGTLLLDVSCFMKERMFACSKKLKFALFVCITFVSWAENEWIFFLFLFFIACNVVSAKRCCTAAVIRSTIDLWSAAKLRSTASLRPAGLRPRTTGLRSATTSFCSTATTDLCTATSCSAALPRQSTEKGSSNFSETSSSLFFAARCIFFPRYLLKNSPTKKNFNEQNSFQFLRTSGLKIVKVLKFILKIHLNFLSFLDSCFKV